MDIQDSIYPALPRAERTTTVFADAELTAAAGTKLLRPTFNHNNFEESFSIWVFGVQRYERENRTQLPDQVKLAVLMNATTGPL